MHFKLIALTLAFGFALFVACDNSRGGSQSPLIGVPLQQAYSAFTGSVGTAFDYNEAVYLDSYNKQVTIFQVEPFDVTAALELPRNVDSEAFFAGRNNQFFILKEKRGFGILKRNGDYLKNPVPMFGEIVAVSYDDSHGRLIVQDNLASVALIRLSDAGDVVASWIGGPIIDGENGILAGTLLRNGTIAVSLTDGQLAKIDFDVTIAAGAWSFTLFDFPVAAPALPVVPVPIVAALTAWSDDEDYEADDTNLKTSLNQAGPKVEWTKNFSNSKVGSNESAPESGLYWLSPVDTFDQMVMARTSTAIYIIDFEKMTLVDTITLVDGESGLHFNRNSGHVIVSNAGQSSHQLIHVGPDGKLLRKKIHNIPVAGVNIDRGVEFSVMDAVSGTLTVMAGLDGQRTIYRNRLSDGLFVGAVDVENFERTVLTGQHVIEILEYELGKAVRTEIQNPDHKVEVKAYNLPQAL